LDKLNEKKAEKQDLIKLGESMKNEKLKQMFDEFKMIYDTNFTK